MGVSSQRVIMAALLGALAGQAGKLNLGALAGQAGKMDLGGLANLGADAADQMTPQQIEAAKQGVAGLLTSGAGTQLAGLLTSGKTPTAEDLVKVGQTAATGALSGVAAPAAQAVPVPTATPVQPGMPRAITEPESRTIANLVQAGTTLPTAVEMATAGAVRLPEAPSTLGVIAGALSGAGRVRTYRKGKGKKTSRKAARRTPRNRRLGRQVDRASR